KSDTRLLQSHRLLYITKPIVDIEVAMSVYEADVKHEVHPSPCLGNEAMRSYSKPMND
ncbi:hypothetical protein Dimus_003853, partial [Dionaea muscipula]